MDGPQETAGPEAVVAFWREAGAERWFAKDAAFDAAFRDRFLDLHFAASRGELDAWAATPVGALALLVLLDQLPRNAFRGSPHTYATDALALALARDAVAAGFDQAFEPALRLFFYLPFAHSEVPADQARSCELTAALGAEMLKHAEHHRDLIARFGRFPHRNRMLARATTPEEQAFLDAGGFAG